MTAPRPRLAAAVLFLLLAGGCARGGAEGDDAGAGAPVVPVRVAALAEREFRPATTAPGQWRAANELVAAAPFAAYVDSVRVEVGDAVKRGAVLATLTTRESRAAVLGARQLVAAASDPATREQARRALAQAERDLVHVPLLATAGGTVVRRSATNGSEVTEGSEVVALVAADALIFEAHVPAADAAHVSAGDAVHVEMEDGTVLDARVRRALPQTSAADQAALVWLAPARPAPAAWLNRFGTAHLAVGAPHTAIGVPDSAIVSDDLTGVLRLAIIDAHAVARWRDVRLGLASGGWHELLAPALAAGTRVVISGQRGLPDSTKVSIEP